MRGTPSSFALQVRKETVVDTVAEYFKFELYFPAQRNSSLQTLVTSCVKHMWLLPDQLPISRILLPSADVKEYLGPTSVTQKKVSLSSSNTCNSDAVKII